MNFTSSHKYFSILLLCGSTEAALISWGIKGAIRATIEIVQNKKLDVYCLHLDAHDATVRRNQLQELVECLPDPGMLT